MQVKFGFTQGLNVARLGLDETQIMTACQIADRMNYDSIWMMDHSNVPQWKNAIVNDAWLMLAAIGTITRNVELGTCVTDAIRRHPSAIALSAITLDRITAGRAILGIGAGEGQNVVDFGIEVSKPGTTKVNTTNFQTHVSKADLFANRDLLSTSQLVHQRHSNCVPRTEMDGYRSVTLQNYFNDMLT